MQQNIDHGGDDDEFPRHQRGRRTTRWSFEESSDEDSEFDGGVNVGSEQIPNSTDYAFATHGRDLLSNSKYSVTTLLKASELWNLVSCTVSLSFTGLFIISAFSEINPYQ